MRSVDFTVRTGRITGDAYIVSVSGEVDMYTAPKLEEELARLLQGGATSAVIDLVEVDFIDSTALGVLLRALPEFGVRGGELVLVTDDRRVLKTLKITGLDAMFVIEAKLADAVARVKASPPSRDGSGNE